MVPRFPKYTVSSHYKLETARTIDMRHNPRKADTNAFIRPQHPYSRHSRPQGRCRLTYHTNYHDITMVEYYTKLSLPLPLDTPSAGLCILNLYDCHNNNFKKPSSARLMNRWTTTGCKTLHGKRIQLMAYTKPIPRTLPNRKVSEHSFAVSDR